MSAPSNLGGRDDSLLSSGKEGKNANNSSLQSKSVNDASSPPKYDSINSALDSITDVDAMDAEFLLADGAQEEKSSVHDTEQLPGSQDSSESEELYLVLSDEGETDNQTDTERNCDEESSHVNKSQTSAKDQSENVDSIGCQKKNDQIPFEETLTCDLNVNENHNNSECSTDSSDLLKLTAEEEMICPPVNDSILDEDDSQVKEQSKKVKSLHSSDVSSSASAATEKTLKEQSVEFEADEISTKDTSLSQELGGSVKRLIEDDSRENMEGSSNLNSSDFNTEGGSRPVTEASLTKAQVSTDSGVSSPSTGQQQPSSEDSSAAKNKSVSETDDVTKHAAVDISTTLPSGLFKDDSLEEFSLSPKDCQALKGDGKSAGVEANGLSEAEQGMSIEDIIDNLSSPIEEDACSMSDENMGSKGETEMTDALSVDDRRANKRAPDPDSLSNDKVEVKKVKLDIVFSDKSSNADAENSEETKNVSSPTTSVDEKQNADVNGEVTKMDINCDDDIDIIEEKPPLKKSEISDEKMVDQPDVKEKQTPVHTEEKKEVKAEVKVNGIATDHSDEDANDEKIHVTSENVDELVIKRISDQFYEDHINTIVALMKKVETLERALEKSRKRLAYYQTTLGNLSSEHRRQLAKLGILPKVHTRTVGVNVRILQEHELQSTNRLGMVKSGLVPPATSATPAQSTPVLTNTTMQLAQQPSAKKTVFPRAATPSGLTPGPRMPSPNVTVSQITVSSAGGGNDEKIRAPSSLQIIPSVGNQGMASPASMMNRPRMQPSILRRQPVSKSPVSATSTGSIMLVSNPALNTSSVASSSSINVIDLTEDADSSLTTTAATSQSSAMLVSPSVTRGPSSNLVPMPLVGSVNSVLQLIPSGPHMGSSISGNNAIRVGRPPTVLPNSACLSQGPRVAYVLQQNPGTLVMPRMDGQVSQIGSLQPHQSPFVTSSGQHVPTILVRMNAPPSNPGAATSSNVVSAAKPTVSQGSAPVTLPSGNPSSSTMLISCVAKHPAPLPPAQVYPENKSWKSLPPRPALKISKVSNGIALSWNMSLFNSHAEIATYQLFAYQESNQAVTSSLWKKVGDVKALPLPMACTLTQFVEGHKYHFAVRAVDVHGRIGPFSDPSSVVLLPRSGQIPSK